MIKLTFILLLFAAGLTQCFPVTTSPGGKSYRNLFYCKNPGCAANVTIVFCNDLPVPTHTHITNCAGPPPPNTVCQHDRRAYVSIDTDADCEFEGKGGYIMTEKCTDHSIICAFIDATTPPKVTTEGTREVHAKRPYIVGEVCGSFLVLLIVIVIIVVACFCKKRSTANNQQTASESDVTVPLREMQSRGGTRDSDTCNSGPGSDGGSSPSQRDRGA
ncbi:uncharacterized protein LOC119492491 [Sebastes umbrosus]|uniref:uncharacterized protein LOC119492491 n=1 Tax=Sebastes umbrosus TaxID=72105 RepID=UPI00189CE34B|nr:uncharacterized protein LOC119492491 [Sebastes umbrosus]